MHSRRDSRYRLNGPMDDVAANIRADQQEAPDPNPTLRCDGCDRAHPAKHYVEYGRASADPNKPLLCSLCNAGITPESAEDRIERRKAGNADVREWVDDE